MRDRGEKETGRRERDDEEVTSESKTPIDKASSRIEALANKAN